MKHIKYWEINLTDIELKKYYFFNDQQSSETTKRIRLKPMNNLSLSLKFGSVLQFMAKFKKIKMVNKSLIKKIVRFSVSVKVAVKIKLDNNLFELLIGY